MAQAPKVDFRALATSCVQNMGDIFWDFDPVRDRAGEYTDPRLVATEAVEQCLRSLASVRRSPSSQSGQRKDRSRT